jgi:acyl-CoA dehydrogenase
MSFALSEEEESIKKSARSFARERVPVSHFRAHREKRHSPEAYREMADLGWLAIPFTEGLGVAPLGIVMEELGRTLAPSPILSALLAGGAAEALVPAITSGEKIIAFAHEEGTRHTRSAKAEVRGGKLHAEKRMVLDGDIADAFVVSAADGLYLASDAQVTSLHLVDDRPVANVRFDGVPCEKVADLGALDALLDRGTAVLTAEMLGGIRESFERTLEHLKTRKQFGVPIGSFQALKHRAAWMFCEIELTQSVVRAALVAIDEGRSDAPALVSAAKAKASDVYLHVAGEAIQMHGGIGATEEHDIGLFYKRAQVAAMTLGDAKFHRDRFATLHGY